MSHKKPDPIIEGKQPNICPVCGKASYSAAGVHPQCSVVKAEQQRAKELKELAKTAAKNKPPPKNPQVSRWQKSCPKCNTNLHVRKKQCDCGHNFNES